MKVFRKCTSQLIIRPIIKAEIPKWEYLMSTCHYLGFKKLLGENIRYIACINNEWAGLISWSAAALKLQSRDSWIGWDRETKERRLKFIANNSRFLILKSEERNLASQILSRNIKRLSLDWERKYGHSVLLAETFVDAGRYKGTCYKASNWIDIGITSGFSKTHNGYIYHGVPKKIFIKPIVRMAREILGSPWPQPYLNETFRPCESSIWRETMLEINKLPIEGPYGLLEMLKALPDPRSRHGVRHRSYGLLALCILGILSGAKNYKSIALWGKSLSLKLLSRIKLKSAPDASTISRFMNKLDADMIDRRITEWLLSIESLYGKAIAIDGKTLKRSHDKDKKPVQLLSAVIHNEGYIVAQKEIQSKTNEIPEVRNLLKPMNIAGSVVTADAMHCQKKTAEFIVKDKNADYLLTAKDNQKDIKDAVANLDNEDFSPCTH